MNEVILDHEAIKMLNKSVNGDGGFQDFLRKLQSQFDKETKTLKYSEDDKRRIKECAEYGKGGGFEDRFKAINECINKSN